MARAKKKATEKQIEAEYQAVTSSFFKEAYRPRASYTFPVMEHTWQPAVYLGPVPPPEPKMWYQLDADSSNAKEGPPQAPMHCDFGHYKVTRLEVDYPKTWSRGMFTLHGPPGITDKGKNPPDSSITIQMFGLDGQPRDKGFKIGELRFPNSQSTPTDPVARVRFMRATVIAMLVHELDEWFKVDGMRVVNPHPNLKTDEKFWLPDEESGYVYPDPVPTPDKETP